MASMAALCASAQDSTSIKVSGYAEVYFVHDLSRPPSGERPDILYNHKRHNEFNLNLGVLRAEYAREGVRASLGLMAGTYAQYNLANEPAALRNIHEARAGLRLSRTRDLWVDAGILSSHIGFESTIGLDQLTLTRSLVAENSPYYEAGAMLSYAPHDRLLVAGLLLNGWQRIQREPGNQRPAFGTQLKFDNKEGTVLNWSTFVGSMGPDSIGEWRFYNNFYARVDSENSGMVLGIDLGLQQARHGPVNAVELQGWWTMVAMYRTRLFRHWWLVGRAEYLLDDQAVVTSGWKVAGASAGLDLALRERAAWRIEYRILDSPDDRFLDLDRAPSGTNMAVSTAFCVRL